MKDEIRVLGARENNLKNINVALPKHMYTVVTGLSGSGKSSLVLDTIYAEGLRRYVECLSTYARQFLERVDRPDMDDITGLPPVVVLEGRNQVKNSRSTVGTTTEIYDYLRLLFAKIGVIFCPNCDIQVKRHSPQGIAKELIRDHENKMAVIMFPVEDTSKTSPEELVSKGFTRVFVGGKTVDIEELDYLPSGSEIVLDRTVINRNSTSRLVGSLEAAFSLGKNVNVRISDDHLLRFTKELECPYCSSRFREPTPLLFSFNSPQGACSECRGFGNILEVDPDLVIPDPEKSLAGGAVEPFTKPSLRHQMRKLIKFARSNGIDTNVPYRSLGDDDKKLIFEGGAGFSGVKGFFRHLEEKSYKMHVRVFLSRYRSAFTCAACDGTRLRREAIWVKVHGRTISELADMPVGELGEFFHNLSLSGYEEEVAKEVLNQIKSRVDFLIKVGLGYVTLSRLTRTLSGGEAQRVNLACQLGSSLTETLYIMDEPSVGLHPRDINRLVSIIKDLRDRGNTVVVVEHDLEMIRSSDYIIELGPLAGEKGGEIVYQGSLKNFLKNSHNSLTKYYLTRNEGITFPQRRKGSGKKLTIIGAAENNLKNITVSFPLETLVCVTGVSGSGKSSLVHDILYSAIARTFHAQAERAGRFEGMEGLSNLSDALMLDQKPIGRSSRSNPVTYIKAYDEVRKIMSGTWSAKARGLTASHFSFNVAGGRCDTCLGDGRQKVEMHFLADVFVTCEDCHGKRFKKEVLEIKYKEKNIDEILNLTIDEAAVFFSGIHPLLNKLRVLQDVGLGYLRLGQPAPTLSGGEAQRIKIARELTRKDGKNILYILDEPTVGLHAEDVKKLIKVLNRLVDAGNTVIVVEHNLDVISSADFVIDLGPEGGKDGGYIVAQGTPEEIAKVKESYTGMYLSKMLSVNNHR